MVLILSLLITNNSYANNACSDIFKLRNSSLSSEPFEVPALNSDLWEPISKGIQNLNLQQKKVKLGSVKWTGQETFETLRLKLPQNDIAERFSAESLNYHLERGRSVADVVAWTYINLTQDLGATTAIRKSSLRVSQNLAKDVLVKLASGNYNFQEILLSLKKILKSTKSWNSYSMDLLDSSTQGMEILIRDTTLEMVQKYYLTSKKDLQAIDALLAYYAQFAKQQGIALLKRDMDFLNTTETYLEKTISEIEKTKSISKEQELYINISLKAFELF